MAYQIISQFIPILVITLGLMFKNDFVRFSNTIIGKIIAKSQLQSLKILITLIVYCHIFQHSF